MNPQDQNNLEHLVTKALRGLPPRKAPRSLEERVLAEIGRRAALPWWRKSFVHWPTAAKFGFAALSVVLMRLMLLVSGWVNEGFTAAQTKATLEPEIQSLQACAHLVKAVFEVAAALLTSIPPLWLYGGIAVIAAMYLALFGLGAAAYRTLHASS